MHKTHCPHCQSKEKKTNHQHLLHLSSFRPLDFQELQSINPTMQKEEECQISIHIADASFHAR